MLFRILTPSICVKCIFCYFYLVWMTINMPDLIDSIAMYLTKSFGYQKINSSMLFRILTPPICVIMLILLLFSSGSRFFLCLLSSVFCLLSSSFVLLLSNFTYYVFCVLCFVFCLMSLVSCLLSFVFCLLSSLFCLQSSLFCLLSSVFVYFFACMLLNILYFCIFVCNIYFSTLTPFFHNNIFTSRRRLGSI